MKLLREVAVGCWTCGRRGYKCDESKPTCYNCIRLNLECEGYGIRLKWQESLVTPRKLKKAVEINTYSSTGLSPSSLSANLSPSLRSSQLGYSSIRSGGSSIYTELTLIDQPNSPITEYTAAGKENLSPAIIASSIATGPSPPIPVINSNSNTSTKMSTDINPDSTVNTNSGLLLHLQITFTLSNEVNLNNPIETHLMTHFMTDICNNNISLSMYTIKNVFSEVVLPLYPENECLKFALCGLSARFISQFNSKYESLSVKYKVDSIKSLRENLILAPSSLTSLSTIMVLATQEAFESNYANWKQHVSGAIQGVMGSSPITNVQSMDPKFKIMLSALEYHDITCSILSELPPMLESIYKNAIHTRKSCVIQADVRQLFHIVAAISALSSEVKGKIYADKSYLVQRFPDSGSWTLARTIFRQQV